MKILALEFSSEHRSTAVVATGPEGTRVLGYAAEVEGRSTRAFSLITAALTEARTAREEVECLAVGLGPGSYTGIRVAISVAQGWQLARNVRLLGLPSTDCLAAQLAAEGVQGRRGLIVDAQRNEFYLAVWEFDATGWRELEPLRLATAHCVAELAASGLPLAGPAVQRAFPDAQEIYPRADALGQLAATRNDFVVGEMLQPVYLRQPTFVKAPPPRVLPQGPGLPRTTG